MIKQYILLLILKINNLYNPEGRSQEKLFYTLFIAVIRNDHLINDRILSKTLFESYNILKTKERAKNSFFAYYVINKALINNYTGFLLSVSPVYRNKKS